MTSELLANPSEIHVDDIEGETTKTNNKDEDSEDSISQNLARLFQKAIEAKNVKNVKDNDKRIKDQQARTQVYNAILKHPLNITKENLRKKTQKARNIFELFSKIGIKKIKKVQSYSADNISKLTGTQIKRSIAHFTQES
ncbi:10108_t:CDS:2 [Funneliformis geosporum]|nr:10108_t:CDS:2 [Funneliformis geosporum]